MKSLVTLFAFTCKCTTFINTVSHSSVAKCAITYFYGLITSFITKISSFFLVFAFLFKDDSILYTLHSLSFSYLNCNTILLWKIVRAHISNEKSHCARQHVLQRILFLALILNFGRFLVALPLHLCFGDFWNILQRSHIIIVKLFSLHLFCCLEIQCSLKTAINAADDTRPNSKFVWCSLWKIHFHAHQTTKTFLNRISMWTWTCKWHIIMVGLWQIFLEYKMCVVVLKIFMTKPIGKKVQ